MSDGIDTSRLSDFDSYRMSFDAHHAIALHWQCPGCKQGWLDADAAKGDGIGYVDISRDEAEARTRKLVKQDISRALDALATARDDIDAATCSGLTRTAENKKFFERADHINAMLAALCIELRDIEASL